MKQNKKQIFSVFIDNNFILRMYGHSENEVKIIFAKRASVNLKRIFVKLAEDKDKLKKLV